MKKTTLVTLITTTALMMLAGCAKAPAQGQAASEPVSTDTAAADKTEADAAAEGDRKTFTVGFDAEFPPYGYMDDNGEYVGFDLELAQEVCNRKGWELKKQPIDWDAKDMELSSGAIDCIWNGFTIQGREDAYTWSVPYVDNSQVFVVKNDGNIKSKADLEGKTVGVQKDSSALAALEGDAADLASTFEDLVQYADYNTGFMDLEAGAIDALAIDIGVANYQIANKGEGYTILEEQLASEQYGIGFLKGNTELKDEVEAVLLEMADDGTVLKIAKDYSDFGMEDAICIGK
ncbi:MAG: amino acid ABC transporter substrate-binding protein [Lachnospiraceae bacterium]|nr:amino acid ABC transporter substrate-binding protein [Lachnospiraceae bacterium]